MEGVRVIRHMINTQLDKVNVAQLGKVVDYNKDTRYSTIQPLVTIDNEMQPLLVSVPVADHVRELEAGDMVVVLFLDLDSDNALLTGQISTTNSSRRHDISDGVVIASLTNLGGV